MAEYNGYTPQTSIDLYVTTGTAADWMYGSRASIAYTFEHAGSAFHPEYTATVPAMYEANRDAMLFLAEQNCLVPPLRPDYSDANVLTLAARMKMAEQGVSLDQLNHAVVRGNAGGPASVTTAHPAARSVGSYAGATSSTSEPARPADPNRR